MAREKAQMPRSLTEDSPFSVFVCSTSDGLKSQREAARQEIEKIGWHLVRQLRALYPQRSGNVAWNVGVHKNWALVEEARMQFRWELFNAFNRANFNNPTTNIQSGDFGLVTTAGAGRSMLFGLRLDF
jgi:hypothetical protein